MKVRMGFVSNSSSASFFIGCPEGFDLKSALIKKYALPESHPLEGIAKNLVKFIIDTAECLTREEMCEQNCWDDKYPMDKNVKDLYDRGWKVYQGGVSNEDYGYGSIGVYLYENQHVLKHDSDDFKMFVDY